MLRCSIWVLVYQLCLTYFIFCCNITFINFLSNKFDRNYIFEIAKWFFFNVSLIFIISWLLIVRWWISIEILGNICFFSFPKQIGIKSKDKHKIKQINHKNFILFILKYLKQSDRKYDRLQDKLILNTTLIIKRILIFLNIG